MQIVGKTITVDLAEEIDLRYLERKNKIIEVDVDFPDNRKITNDQRKKIFALINDIAEYTGYPNEYIRSELTFYFELEFGIEKLTLKSGGATIQQASDFIEYIIRFCFNQGIPFYERNYYLDSNDSRILYYYTMNRRCFVCGSHADIHHYDALGMGRNRKKHDHSQHRFMALCRAHHNEIHQIGREIFCEKYHLKPIKLDGDDIRELKL